MSVTAVEKARATDDEPDRLAGFSAPRDVDRLFGHAAALGEFQEALHSGRMHHAWLLAGPEGIGKATLAYAVARGVLALNEPPGVELQMIGAEHPVFRKVAALSHPNLLLLRRSFVEKSKRYSQWIGVEEVRRLRAFLGNSAGERGWRVVIVDRADELNPNAANALLKTLEEPPPQTLFLLIASAEGRVPVTIRSRARALRVAPLAAEELEGAVRAALARDDHEVDEATLATALGLSEGSVRRALELVTGEGIALHGELLALLNELPHFEGTRLHRLVERLGGAGDSERLELFVALLLGLLERLVRSSVIGEGRGPQERGPGHLLPEEKELAARLIGPDNQAFWAEAWEEIGRAQTEAAIFNLDRSLLVLETFYRLQQLVRERPAAQP
jgi:DNA polymerase-3 subunit delta'